jgi:hypothetical protein
MDPLGKLRFPEYPGLCTYVAKRNKKKSMRGASSLAISDTLERLVFEVNERGESDEQKLSPLLRA